MATQAQRTESVTSPQSDRPSRSEVEAAIRHAFQGVRLGRGISLSIAELIDDWAEPAIIESLLGTEPDEDWASISVTELERAYDIAHLDAEGLRYYLPALMLHLVDDYQPTEMWCSGTISALDQRDGHPPGFLDLLSPAQRKAIAMYVTVLPALIDLQYEDASIVRRAYRDVWSRELGEPASASD